MKKIMFNHFFPFATGVIDVIGAPWISECICEFSNKLEISPLEKSVAWRNMIHDKT
jgi:hypothetical protein